MIAVAASFRERLQLLGDSAIIHHRFAGDVALNRSQYSLSY